MRYQLLLVVFVGFMVFINSANAQNEIVNPTKVSTAIYFDELPSLKDLPPVDNQYYIDNWERTVTDGFEKEPQEGANFSNWKDEGPDPVWQKENGWVQNSSKALIKNFAGQSSPYYPSDCNGTVGPNHYMQTVNTTYAIYDKTGTQVVAPTAMNTLFSGVAGSTNNDGDPLILFDEQAQKWVAVEFSVSNTPYYMLIAVSQTDDPTGAWWRWSFVMNGFPDYEKLGIWHDGYYMGTNLGSTSSTSDDVYVFERSAMITGAASPQMVQFHNPNRPVTGFHAIMPLDADGASGPSSSPGQYITINDNAWGGNDEIRIFECAVNWTTPASSTFSMTQQISVASFDSQFNSWGVGDIDQLSQSQRVDAAPYVLMARGQYKNWGTDQTIVCVHTVDVDGTNHAGQRWYELEKTSQTDLSWSIKQQGTYAPDGHSRFMGSIAMNNNRDIALGYSISSSTMSPNIRYTGQTAGAPLGILNVAESADLATGTASQPSFNRWGDYSLMTIDPVDNTTFWFTTEYYSSGKKTRIMSFTFDPPVLTADFTGTPTSVNIGNDVTFTDASFGPNTLSTWMWNFPNGTPSTASGQGPHTVTYNTVGTYDVSLTVTDVASGSDSQTKTNYINAINCTISSFPWTEGFENGGAIPDCWSNEYVIDSQNWAYQNGGNNGNPSSAHSGSYNAYLYNPSTTANVTKLVTPMLDVSSFSSATLTFWHTQAFWSPDQDELRVYYKTSAAGSWNLLDTYTNSLTIWTQETISLPSLSNDYYIAFEGTAQYGYGVCVDDVNVDGVSGGAAPIANFAADILSPAIGQTVTFSDLSTNTPTSWLWSFSPSTITYVNGTSATDPSPEVTFDAYGAYTVTLTAANTYGSDNEIKANYINLTNCTISAFPWTEGFENGGSIPNCWSNEYVTNTQNWAFQNGGNNSKPAAAHSGSYNAFLYNSSTTANVTKLVSPVFDMTGMSAATLIFWHTQTKAGQKQDEMRLYYKNSAGGSWTILATYTANLSVWTQETIILPSLSDDYYIAFEGRAQGGHGVCIDEVSIITQADVEILWTGTTNTDWNNTGNWSGSTLPTSSDNVTIPTSPSGGNFPEINLGAGAVCNNLIIQAGAHLYIPFYNILTVSGTLVNSAGTSGFVIKSGASGTASLIHSTANVNATVERYLTDGRWHFVGIPVNSAFAGVFQLSSGHSDIYLRTHIESSNTWDNNIVPVNTPLIQGRGYEVWVGNPAGFTQPETVEFVGSLNSGDYTTGIGDFYPLEYTSGRGLNLISNPFPSAIQANIGSGGWTKTNIDNSVWTWDAANGNYVYWNGTDGTGGGDGVGTMTGGIIPAMQGFFVLANASGPSITIPNSDRLHSSQAFYKNTSSGMPNTIRLDISGNNYQDAVFVSFNENATENYDEVYDVKKLFGLPDAPQLYTVIADEQLSINSFPLPDEHKLIQLGLECEVNGEFIFTASELDSFTEYIDIYLEDTKEGILQKLNDNPQYNFSHNTSDEAGRFLLHFGAPSGINDIDANNINIYSNRNYVYIQSNELLQGEVSIYDMLGQEIIRQEANGENIMKIKIENGVGYYVVRLQSAMDVVTDKVLIK